MIDDERADYLAEVAQELITRIRDDDPEANGRWLAAMLPNPIDWWQLIFVQAAANPDDKTFRSLTAWVEKRGEVEARRLMPHGTAAAASRHRYYQEQLCEACKIWDRDRKRDVASRRHMAIVEDDAA